MQFDVQTVKLPATICEKPSVLNCQVPNGAGTPQDLIHNYTARHNNVSESELITPKKPTNPCLESLHHQHLHKELLFNNKIGKSVLNQKSELDKALEKYKDTQIKKELERQKLESRSALEKAIEERAKKIESVVHQKYLAVNTHLQEKPPPTEAEKLEFLQIHAKLCAKSDPK